VTDKHLHARCEYLNGSSGCSLLFELTYERSLLWLVKKFTLKQATKVQSGEWNNSSTLSLTSALDGGVWSVPLLGHFTPRNAPVPIV